MSHFRAKMRQIRIPGACQFVSLNERWAEPDHRGSQETMQAVVDLRWLSTFLASKRHHHDRVQERTGSSYRPWLIRRTGPMSRGVTIATRGPCTNNLSEESPP